MLLHGPSTFRINSTERIAWAQDLSQRAPSMLLYGPSTFTIISRFPPMASVRPRIVLVGASDTLAWAQRIQKYLFNRWRCLGPASLRSAPLMPLYGPSMLGIIFIDGVGQAQHHFGGSP